LVVAVRFEFSAGGVVVRETPDGPEVILAARRTRSGELAWGLPKGMVEEGERVEDAAVREVREETGLEARVLGRLEDIEYWYVWEGVRVHKRVAFFAMAATGGDVSEHDHEMEEVRWFPLDRAESMASFRKERSLLRQAAGQLGTEAK
jgi:ADP-ribose pyrophosphatase YjhB (NUDIX family)